ncbi:hypothetical protein [Pelagibius sp. Alg239-R121]|uniref:hypothetical protein n=1 Tax=Pelagibius sp. Alg239-R121 TaxID=2993448 RepID=UPI0024A6E13F|nr:hypothetical protein [Pelagibius sp. Alg239-R121]
MAGKGLCSHRSAPVRISGSRNSGSIRQAALAFGCGLAVAGFVTALILPAPTAQADAAGRASLRAAHFGAGASTQDDFHGLDTVSLAEMSDLRGGFNVGGLEMAIGANIRTFVDGALVLESVAQVSPSGLISELVSSTASPPGGGVTFNFGRDTDVSLQDVAPSNVDLGALAGDNGVAINDSNGFSAALHRITQSQILGVIVNTADGRSLRQELNINVTVQNFGSFQKSIRNAITSGRLINGINRAN